MLTSGELEGRPVVKMGGEETAAPYEMGEIFCGAGGLSLGFHPLGFRPRFANDIWGLAVHNFLMNFDPTYEQGRKGEIIGIAGSVEDVDPTELLRNLPSSRSLGEMVSGEMDVMLGGPPCQGFSVNSHTRNGDDPRNSLFRHYVRMLRVIAPKVFVLENVPGMFSLEGGRFIDELLSDIGALNVLEYGGYEITFKILNAAHYGAPQERFRLVMVGTRRDVADAVGPVELPAPERFSFASAHFKGGRSHTYHYAIGHRGKSSGAELNLPEARLLAPTTIEDAIGDLPAISNGGGSNEPVTYGARGNLTEFQRSMRGDAQKVANHWARALHSPNTERVKHIPEGGDWRSIPHDLLPPGMQRALRKDHTTRYGRMGRTNLSGTLLTKPDPHWGTFIHYDKTQERLISVREAARIQSFPDAYTFHGGQVDQYKLCGNAVPPLMAQAVARQVRRTLDAFNGRANDTNSPVAARLLASR